VKIYMTDIVPFGDEKIFAQMLPFITEDRKNKIMQLKKKEDRCRSLAAGLLLEYALREYGVCYQGKCSRCILDSERKENRY